MKKFVKPLKYLGFAVLLFIGLLYLINLIPTKLDPRVEEIQKQDLKALYDRNKTLPEFIQFLEKGDLKFADDLKTYGKMLEKDPYPLELRFPQIVKLGQFLRWNESYLASLKRRPEADRYQALKHSLNFIEKGIRNPDSLVQAMILLLALKKTALEIKEQELNEEHFQSLQAQVAGMVEDRVFLLKTTLESEFRLQVYFVAGAESESWGLMEDSKWAKAFTPLWKPFFNGNATLNEAREISESYRKASECLETWNCKEWTGQSEFHFWQNPRNPIGKMLLRMVDPMIQARLLKIQQNWKSIHESIQQAPI